MAANQDLVIEVHELTKTYKMGEVEVQALRGVSFTIQRGEVDPIGIASGAEPITLLVEARFLPHALELYNAYYAGSGVEQPQPDQE